MLTIINKIREDRFNIEVLNYISMVYLFFLLTSYRISGTILYIIVVIFFLNKNFKEHLFLALKNRFVQSCIAYFLVFIVWILASDNYAHSLMQVKIYKFLIYSIIFVAIVRKEFFEKYFYILLIGTFINLIWLYLSYFKFISQENYLLLQLDQAFLIFLSISYSLFRLLKYNDNVKYKILLIIFICLGSIGIFMLKKTEIVLYLFIVFFTIIYIYKNNLYKIFGVFFMFLCFFVLVTNFLLSEFTKNQLVNELDGISKSIGSDTYITSMGIRIGVAKYSFEVIKENLFFGVGTGDHSFAVKKKIDESNLKETSLESYNYLISTLFTGTSTALHNTYLQSLVQFGIIGFLFFINIFYQIFRYLKNVMDINSCLLITILTMLLLRFNTGWDFQFGNLGQLFIITVAILLSSKIDSSKSDYN